MPRGLRKRPVFGLQITNLHEEYPKLIWQGVVDQAEELDIDIIILRGESLNTPYIWGYQCNAILELIKPTSMDALIIASGTVCNFITNKEFVQYIDKLSPIPLVSLSIPLEGHPSVIVDNSSGLREAIIHLITEHHRKKVAFIRGPKNNMEAEIRYRTYLDTLELLGIEQDDRLVIEGNFTVGSGIESVKELLDNRKCDFDALIASNDNMAIGAMKELLARNIEIPDAVSIVGFDNIPDCENIIPPLSTVKQPIYLQAKKAVKLAYDQFLGKKTQETVILPTSFKSRSSCGCIGHTGSLFKSIAGKSKTIAHLQYQKAKEKLREDIHLIIELTEYSGTNTDLSDRFIYDFLRIIEDETVVTESYDSLSLQFNKALTREMRLNINILYWKEVLAALYQFSLAYFPDKMDSFGFFHQKSLTLLYEYSQTLQISNRIREERLEDDSKDFLVTILPSQSLAELLDNIENCLDKLGINSFFLYLYKGICAVERGEAWVMPDEVSLVFGRSSHMNKRLSIPDGQDVKTCIIPDEFNDRESRHTYAVWPMYFRNVQYGYFVLELSVKAANVYEFLSIAIGSAYQQIVLLGERELAEQRLEEERNKLKKRNLEMENEIMLARRIQNQLIPLKTARDYIGYCYKPTDMVGGDFFDFIEFREKNWVGLFISDVSGHGVPAAFITTMIKSTVQQIQSFLDNPAFVLQALNQSLINICGGNFITAFYGIYKADTRRFIYSNAGHNSPYIIHNGSIISLNDKSRGMPLAIIQNDELLETGRAYMNQTVELDRGSKLLLYTDGLIETSQKNAPENDFEEVRLKEAFIEHESKEAQDFVDQIYLELEMFHGSGKFNDDICMICVDIK